MFIIKRQRITGIHSSRREVHDWLDVRGDWVAQESEARVFTSHGAARIEATCQRAENPHALSIVVRDAPLAVVA